jgi:hypothetical protein
MPLPDAGRALATVADAADQLAVFVDAVVVLFDVAKGVADGFGGCYKILSNSE